MKRTCLVLALLLAGAVSTANADYVLIVANLGLATAKRTDANTTPPPGQAPGPLNPGLPGGAAPGFPGQPPAAGLPPGGDGTLRPPPSAPFDPDAVPTMILAVIEIEKKLNKTDMLALQLRGMINSFIPFKVAGLDGRVVLANTSISKVIPLHPNGKAAQSLGEVYAEMLKALADPKVSGLAEKWIELAEWCLAHGLLDHFKEHMEKAASIDKADPKIANYLQMKATLAKPVQNDDAAGNWRKQLLTTRFETVHGGHYALLHSNRATAEGRLKRLEDALQTYYYWFALRGQQLPVPTKPLVAILSTDLKDKEFKHLHDVLDSTSVAYDSFFARRENISVYSDHRLDDAYDRLDKMAAPYWNQGFDRQLLLKGTSKGFPKLAQPVEKIEAMTLALLLRVMELEGEVAGSQNGATVQLIYSAGLLPPGVAAPEWIQFGVSSFFTTSPGSPWPTVGLPNFEFGPLYRDLVTYKKLPSDGVDLLKQVVTDGFFRNPAPGLKKEAATRNARATAWSLAHFLLRKKLDGVFRYFKELSQLPRDVALDEQTLWVAFAKAFNAVDATGQPDTNVLRELADDWDKDVRLEQYDPREIELMRAIRLAYKQAVTSATAPPPASTQFGANPQPGGGLPGGGIRPGFGGGIGGVRGGRGGN